MDIWSWVRRVKRELKQAGNARLAELIDNLSHVVCEGRHAQVDAMVPEALALARAAKAPWLEVFIRHWHLQSKVFHRHEVTTSLPEAVSLLEFANRDDTRDCPQSVCVTQDLAKCYGRMDGPGYVDERLSVASETLARIDARWPCFRCISAEQASALLDGRRFEDAIAFIDDQRAQIAQAGQSAPGGQLNWCRAAALLALGRNQQALTEVQNWDVRLWGKSNQQAKSLMCALAMIRIGEVDDARALIPSVEEIFESESNYISWARCMRGLCERSAADNTWQLGRDLWVMKRRLASHGAAYEAATMARIAAQLAIARGAKASAHLCLQAINAIQGELKATEHLAARVEKLASAVQQMPDTDVPDDVTEQAFFDSMDRNPEIALDHLAAAGRRWPDSEQVACVAARVLRVLGHLTSAEGVLRRFLDSHPQSQAAFMDLADTLLQSRDHAALADLLDCLKPPLPPYALWCRARSEHMRHELDRCADTLTALIAAAPDAVQASALLADVERSRGDWDAALAVLDDLVTRTEPGEADWDRMVAATVVGDWAKVREAAARIGLELDGDGPIELSGELCQIKLKGEWRDDVAYAQRTGPVTARVLSMGRAGEPGHFRDVVVFDPAPLDPPDRSESDGDEQVRMYAAVHTIERGGMAIYSIDGVHPGDAALDRIAEAIQANGGEVRVVSDDDYRADVSDTESAPAVYALIALPEGMSPQAIHELLCDATAALEHPMVWLDIAEALDDAEFARQQEIARRYSLV